MSRLIKAVTYNIHGCVGTDGKYEPSRIAGVLKEVNADLIGLQEVDTTVLEESAPPIQSHIPSTGDRRHPGFHPAKESYAPSPLTDPPPEPILLTRDSPMIRRTHQLDYLIDATGHQAIEGFVLERKAGKFGNALLTSFKVLAVRRVDLTIRGARQRRGALDVDLQVDGELLRVFVTHLGLGMWERYFQIQRLIGALGNDLQQRVLMMGDFNIWSSMFPRFRRLHRRLGPVPLVTTFPSRFPIFPLDRMWLQPKTALKSIAPHKTPLSRLASDHLPLVAHCSF